MDTPQKREREQKKRAKRADKEARRKIRADEKLAAPLILDPTTPAAVDGNSGRTDERPTP
jgi:hypothetical protein